MYRINNINKLENEIILIRKYILNDYLKELNYNKKFNTYSYKIKDNYSIENFNEILNNFIIFLRKNYKNEKMIIQLYNFLNLIEIDKIIIKKNNKYTIKKYNHKTNRLKQYNITYKEILEKLINIQLLNNYKRFKLYFRS